MLRPLVLLALLLASGVSAQTDSTAVPDSLRASRGLFWLSAPPEASADLAPRIALTLDPSLSAEAGADALVAAHRGLTELEDRVLPTRLWRERGVLRKAGGIGYRLARLVIADEPLAHTAFLLQHEVFGHGARIREFGLNK